MTQQKDKLPFPTYKKQGDKGTKFCTIRKRFFGEYDYCPFCNEHVKEGNIVLVISNGRGAPNAIVHEQCWSNDAYAASLRMIELYHEARQVYDKQKKSGWNFGRF